MRRTLGAPSGLIGPTKLLPDDGRRKVVLLTVITTSHTCYLAHSHVQLTEQSGNTQEGTPFTSTNTPARIDWSGELWAASDIDGVAIDVEVEYR